MKWLFERRKSKLANRLIEKINKRKRKEAEEKQAPPPEGTNPIRGNILRWSQPMLDGCPGRMDCLTYAASQKWPSMSCEECQRYLSNTLCNSKAS